MKLLSLVAILLFSSCATPRVILGEIEVYGNNEIKIDAPQKR